MIKNINELDALTEITGNEKIVVGEDSVVTIAKIKEGLATETYVDSKIGAIDTILDNLNGEEI